MRCIGENIETYKTCPVEFEKEEEENEENETKAKIRKYRLKFIDSYRFFKKSLGRLVDNLSEINSKTCDKCKERTKTTQYCEFVKLKENRLMYKCLNCKDLSSKSINFMIKKFSNTYKSCYNNKEKFVLFLRKRCWSL